MPAPIGGDGGQASEDGCPPASSHHHHHHRISASLPEMISASLPPDMIFTEASPPSSTIFSTNTFYIPTADIAGGRTLLTPSLAPTSPSYDGSEVSLDSIAILPQIPSISENLTKNIHNHQYHDQIPEVDFSSHNNHRHRHHHHNNLNNNNNYETGTPLNGSMEETTSMSRTSSIGKPDKHIEISRSVLTMKMFSDVVGKKPRKDSFLDRYRKCFQLNDCRNVCSLNTLKTVLPILQWLPGYSIRNEFLPDFIAGLTISILHIPQGIAYAMLAGVPPVHGLYVSFFPVLIYAIFGTSRHISVGTFAVASIMLNNIVMKMNAIDHSNVPPVHQKTDLSNHSSILLLNKTDPGGIFSGDERLPPTPLEVVTSVGLLCGLIQISMGLFRLGSLSLILSDQLVSAFSTAVSIHVATSQYGSIFGFTNVPTVRSGPFKLIRAWITVWNHWKEINISCLCLSIGSIVLLMGSKEIFEPKLKNCCSFPLPSDLILVIFSIGISAILGFNKNLDIQVVKTVPTGLPKPSIPRIDLIPQIFVDSLVLSVLCFAVSLSLAKIFSKKSNYHVRPNQELVAIGTANVFSSFFMAYPCSAALSRSTLQYRIGGITQMAGLISSAIVLMVLLFLAPFLYHLPKYTLSCIVLVALKSMFLQISDFTKFWNISRLDGIAWLITFLSVIILDIDYGLIIGILTSILVIMLKLAFPRLEVLGQVIGTEIYAEIEYYQNLLECPGMKIFRFYSPLFYLNADSAKEKIMNVINELTEAPGIKKVLILDLAGISFIDNTGIDVLIDIVKYSQKCCINTRLVNGSGYIWEILERTKFRKNFTDQKYSCKFYPTVHDAVIDFC